MFLLEVKIKGYERLHVQMFSSRVCAQQFIIKLYGGARGVVVIVVGNGHGDTISNPGPDWIHFT